MEKAAIEERIANLHAMREEILERMHYNDIYAEDQWALAFIKNEMNELREMLEANA
jgi:hypothetical protein